MQNFGTGTDDADLTDLAVLNGNQLLFGAVDGATGNELWRVEEPPSVFLTDPLSDQRIVIGETQTYLLENAFSTPPGATVTYSVSSADESIATARAAPELAQLIVEAVGLGTTTITYEAEVNGQAVEDSFQLEVVEPFPTFTVEALIGRPSEVCSDPTDVTTCDPLSPFVPTLTPRADTLDLAVGDTALVRYIITNTSNEDLFDAQLEDEVDGVLASAATLIGGDSLVVNRFIEAPTTFGLSPRRASGTVTDDQGLTVTSGDLFAIDVQRPVLRFEVRTAKAADFCTDITDPSTCDSVPDGASAFILRDDTLRTYARDTVLVQLFARNDGIGPVNLTELTSTQLGSVLPSGPSTLAPSDSLVVNRITEAPISTGITGEVGEARVQDAGGNEAIERDPYGFIVELPVAGFDARLQAASEVCSDVTDVSTCGVVGNPRDVVDVAPGQPVLVQYSLENFGNVPFRAVTVTNSLFGPVVTDTSVYVPPTGNDSLVINRLYDAPQGAGLTEFITRATVKDAGGNAGNVGPEETDVLAFSISDPIVRLDVRLRKAEEVCTDPTDPQTCGLIGTPRNTIEVNATEPVHARYVIRNFTEPSTITQVTLVGDVEGAVLQDEPVSIAPGDSLIIKRIFPAPSEAKQTSSVVSLVATDSGGNAASEAEVMVYDVPAPGLVFNARVARAADFCTDPTDASTCSSSFSNLNPNTVPIGTGENAYVRYIFDIPFNAPDITEVTLTDSYVGSILSAEPVNFGPKDSLIVKRIYAAPEVPGIQRVTTQATVADAGGNQVSISRQYGYNVEPVGFQFDVRVDRASNACSDVTDVSTCFNISPQLPDTVEALSPGTPYLVRYVVQNLGNYTVLENITITDENQGVVTQMSNAGLGSSDFLGINRIYTATGTAGIDPVRVSAVIGDAFGNTSTLDIAYGLQGTGPQFRPVILLGPASVFCSDPNDLSTCSRARLKRMQANPELAQKALAKNGIEREAVLYSFINTGTETFTRHTVNDNVSGNVLADEAISVAPLDSIEFFRIYDEVAAIGDQRTVTWTAATADGDVLTNGSASEPLPVELASFGAAVAGREVTLEWITASEENNAGFEVQQFDQETESWTRLTFVEGAGTTNEAKTYRYPVADLEPDVHQFRLRQIDVSGRFAISQPIEATVMIDGPFRLTDISPHPVRGTGDLSLTVREPQSVRAEIYDLLGRRVASVLDADLTAGRQHPMTLDASRLSSGVYFLRVIGETFATTQRVTVVR